MALSTGGGMMPAKVPIGIPAVEPDAYTEVVIVGAGPTGLLLAGDLAEAGVRCTVLERRVDEANTTRAFGVHARTLEELDVRGLADELVATGAKVDRLQLFGNVAIDLSTLPSRFPYLLITPQYEVERVLMARARKAGATITTGADVTGVDQDDRGVDVHVAYADGREEMIHAGYAVGADGVHSSVREAIGMPYPGESVLRSIMLADVRLSESPPETLVVDASRDTFAFMAPFGDGWFRIFCWDLRNQQPDNAPVDLAEIAEVTRRSLGSDYGMHDPRWISRFHCDERQVPRYRDGRVFLAGDAAHCHSPAAAQGMNTGLQDSVNLGWKLIAVLRDGADDALLDSYDAERHPVGHLVIRSSGALVRAATLRPWVERMARNLIGGIAMRVKPIAGRVGGTISGLSIDYPAPPGAHPAVGTRAPDVPLEDPHGRLYEVLRGGRFVLISPVRVPLEGLEGRRVIAVTPAETGVPTTLIRPDGYVAWASDETAPRRLADAVRDALAPYSAERGDGERR